MAVLPTVFPRPMLLMYFTISLMSQKILSVINYFSDRQSNHFIVLTLIFLVAIFSTWI